MINVKKVTRCYPYFLFQYNDNNRSYNTKVVRTNFPLHMVDRLTQGLAELCKGIKYDF